MRAHELLDPRRSSRNLFTSPQRREALAYCQPGARKVSRSQERKIIVQSENLIIGLVLCVTPALLAAQASSTAQNPLHRQYHDGETLVYNMTGLNESWHYTIQAQGIVKKDASGAYFEEYHWTNLVSDGQPTALSPGSDSFRERLSLDPDQNIAPPDLSNADPKLVGPALDFMTFYADLWLANKTGQLTHAGDHFYVKVGTPSSWAVLVVRHIPPEKSQVTLPAAWMQAPVSDTPNNWVQVVKLPGKFLGAVGQETFTDELTISLVDGKILSASMDNTVKTIMRTCNDEALTQCDPAQPHEIIRKIQIALVQ